MQRSINRNFRKIHITQASQKNLEDIRKLFREYAASLGFDLGFQDFDEELAELPGEYSQPDGRLFLATYGKKTVGCVALRWLKGNVCEMKRLYVRPEFRGKGIGRSLAKKIIKETRKIGYTTMRLDTIPSMKQALVLYKSLGFRKIKPYRYNPIKGATYWELRLT